MQTSVIIPAYNESGSIGKVIDAIDRTIVRKVIVVDNGSDDGTGEVAGNHGAVVVRENKRGYGYACLAGILAAGDCDIIVFLDGDYSDYPDEIQKVILPLVQGDADLVIGSRVLGGAEKGSLTIPQRFGNFLAVSLLNWIFHTAYTDLGPFRAIRKKALDQLAMKDKKYGWTVEMQIKAAFQNMKIAEVPVSYRKRYAGRSKVSGNVKGVFLAGSYILYYVFQAFFLTLIGRRKKTAAAPGEV